jgi:hypothetical protein
MFWIAMLVFGFSWVLIKLGFLSATTGFLVFIIKVLIFVIVVGAIAFVWMKLRKKDKNKESDQDKAAEN